jgi:hypothetical protein
MSPRQTKRKLEAVNPLPENAKADQPLDATGYEFAEDGYSVLARANPADRFQPNRQLLSQPIYEGPDYWDDE